MITDTDGREVVDMEFEYNNDGSAFLSCARYADDGSMVPMHEIEAIEQLNPSILEDAEFRRSEMQADDFYDSLMDR